MHKQSEKMQDSLAALQILSRELEKAYAGKQSRS